MNLKTRKALTIATIVGVIVILGLAIFGVVWGVTHRQETQPLQVCWQDDLAYYSPSGGRPTSCSNPEEIIYEREQVPLSVKIMDSSDPTPRRLEEAISIFNSRARFKTFRVWREGEVPRVRLFEKEILSSTDEARNPAGSCRHIKIENQIYAEVRLGNVITISSWATTTAHELGHAIGLPHNNFRGSLMYPFQISQEIPWMSDANRDFLQRTYN